jgi:hypothetical protein
VMPVPSEMKKTVRLGMVVGRGCPEIVIRLHAKKA